MEDSQFLADVAQPGLGVSQFQGQVMPVLAGQDTGWAGCGLSTGGLEGAGLLLCPEVVPLLSQVHDYLQQGREGVSVRAPVPGTVPALELGEKLPKSVKQKMAADTDTAKPRGRHENNDVIF